MARGAPSMHVNNDVVIRLIFFQLLFLIFLCVFFLPAVRSLRTASRRLS